MPADYETRLDRLEAAQGIGTPQFVVVLEGEDEAAKLAEFRRERGLPDDYPVHVLRLVFGECPLNGSPSEWLPEH